MSELTTLSQNGPVLPQVTLTELPANLQYLLVALAGREYGVRLDTLQEVLRFNAEAVAPLPNTPEWVEGVISLRGTIVSVVSLRLFLGFEPVDDAGPGLVFDLGFRLGGPIPRLLVVYSGELQVALQVDDILGVIFVDPTIIVPAFDQPDAINPYLEGIYNDPQSAKLIALLDARKLITSSQMLQFEPPNQ